MLSDLVEYGRKVFTIEILQIVPSETTDVDLVEDNYIESLDTIHPNGYNLRLNRTLVQNGTQDLSNIEISAKYVFDDEKSIHFTIGACSQNRSYQTLLNCKDTPGLQKKIQFGFDYFEIKLEKFEYHFTPSVVYNMTIKYDEGWKILEVWDAV